MRDLDFLYRDHKLTHYRLTQVKNGGKSEGADPNFHPCGPVVL